VVDFFIHRPVFASVIAVIMILTGLIAYSLLPVAQFPEITPPQVVVTATYPGRRQHRNDPARATDQRRARHGLHVVGQRQ
jgi:multidrug efflux pump subunit AcrB